MFEKWFKKAGRRSSAEQTTADLQNAYQKGQQFATEIMAIIDAYFERAIIGAAHLKDTFEQQLEIARISGDMSAIIPVLNDYYKEIDWAAGKMREGVDEQLRGYREVLGEFGIRDVSSAYTEKRIKEIEEAMREGGKNQAAYVITRMRGIITDEMHAMTPEQLREFMKAGN